MELFHGSLVVVQQPRLLRATHTSDFGPGFYTTSSREQARRFAVTRMRNSTQSRGYVSAYNLDERALDALSVLRFQEAGHDWLMFVVNNRLSLTAAHDYDVVVGPVADDNVYGSIMQYMQTRRNEDVLLRDLLTTRLVDQWLFHTERALRLLTYMGNEEVQRDGGHEV